jgi:drug/metabolite transporter (DMT)-like permease
VNAYRTVIAVGLLLITQFVLLGTILPLASGPQWFWLGASGIVGLGIGDSGLFAAYVILGPRRSLLLMALAPIFASLGGYVMLGETIPAVAAVGIALTLGGVVLVILEREEHSGETPVSNKLKSYGIFFGLVAAIGQGVGLVLAKKGIELNPAATLNPISATLMRMILGACSVWLVLIAAGRLPELRRAFKSREGMRQTLAAAVVGPFLGVTLSMVAVTYAEVGIAQTLLSLMPVMIIPVVWILYRQRTSWRGILGALIAVIGVAVLFLV